MNEIMKTTKKTDCPSPHSPVIAASPPDDRLTHDYVWVIKLSSGTGLWARFHKTKSLCHVRWWNRPSPEDLEEVRHLNPWRTELGVRVKPESLEQSIDDVIEPKKSVKQ